jgi:CDK inhibitor PHO81
LDKKHVVQSRTATNSKVPGYFVSLFEGFQQFDGDLNKLQVPNHRLKCTGCAANMGKQQFVAINETAVSKILKKVRRLYDSGVVVAK